MWGAHGKDGSSVTETVEDYLSNISLNLAENGSAGTSKQNALTGSASGGAGGFAAKNYRGLNQYTSLDANQKTLLILHQIQDHLIHLVR